MRLEDIEAWASARELARAVYQATASDRFAGVVHLRDHLRESVATVMAWIAEGSEHDGSKAAMFRLFSMAKGETGKVSSYLYIALDQGLLDRRDFDRLYAAARETGQQIVMRMRRISRSDEEETGEGQERFRDQGEKRPYRDRSEGGFRPREKGGFREKRFAGKKPFGPPREKEPWQGNKPEPKRRVFVNTPTTPHKPRKVRRWESEGGKKGED